ncbi:MAG: TonB-dependent receptor [Marinifilaceae bacterium]
MKKLITLACLLFIAISSFAQTCTISGKVVDKKGNSLEMASVIIKELQKAVNTNQDGTFVFKDIKKGEYTVIIDYIGYKTFKKKVSVQQKNNSIKIILTSKNILTEDIIVFATRAGVKTPMAYTNMDKEQLSKLHNGKDITFMLSSIPSVVATSESGTGIGNTAIRVRGTDPTRINVCMNGIPMNDSESQAVFWANVPDFASSVNNIQVQRGVGSSTNGAGAFGATVNFQTTKINEKPYASADFAGGSFNTFIKTFKAGSGIIANNFTFDVRFSDLDSDGYIRNAFADHKSTQMSATYFNSNTIIKANIILGEQHTGISWWGTPEDKLKTDRTYNPAGKYKDANGNTQFYKDQTDNYWQNHYQLIMNHSVSNKLKLNMALHATTGKGYYEQYKAKDKFKKYIPSIKDVNGNTKSDIIRQKHLDNIFYGITASALYSIDKLDITIGGAANRYDGDHFGNVIWSGINNSTFSKDYEWYRNNGKKDDANIFTKVNYQISPSLNIYGDMQYRYINYKMTGPDDDLVDISQENKFNFVNPKFGLVYDINTNSKLYTSFAVGNREPTRTTLKDAIKDSGKSTPKAETMYDYELGYTFNNETFYANVNAYYMDYKDQLVHTGKLNTVGDAIMTNVDKSYRAGIEISASYKFCEFFKWSANTTISRNIIKDYSQVQYYNDANWNPISTKDKFYGDRQISYSPYFIASSMMEFFPVKNISIGLNSKYVGKQYFDNTENNNRSIDAYFINNIIINYNFKIAKVKSINLQLALNNILEEKYSNNATGWFTYVDNKVYHEYNYFTQAGFNFMIKTSINF